MSCPSGPIQPNELAGLFVRVLPADKRVALAVSGGSDSTALMVLVADWLRQVGMRSGGVAVLTVDHRLRAESAAEAETVRAQAGALGFSHATLAWEGPKPLTGIQAAARAARYRLIACYMHAHGYPLLLTAHTRDDQAETVLMRLGRGSGLDGLAAIAPLSALDAEGLPDRPALMVARPLLDVSKARLRATLEARGIAWSEDASNASPAFERPRLRAAQAQLEALGLTPERLALSARRLQRARGALESAADAFWDAASGRVRIDTIGVIGIDRPALQAAPEEIALRVLARAVSAAGGSGEPVPLARLETIAAALRIGSASAGWTLARAMITTTAERILIAREPGREPLPTLALAAGEMALWDGRFRVRAGASLEAPVDVRALGGEGVGMVRRMGCVIPADAPVQALRALPGFWRGSLLLAVPSLDHWASESAPAVVSATFIAHGQYNFDSPPPDPEVY